MENNLLPMIPAVEAVDCPKIKTLPPLAVYNPLVVLIGHLYLLKGQRPEPEELRFQAGELDQELRANYGFLSLEEIRIALDKGVKKRYGEYYGLNVVTYIEWLDAYIKSDLRHKALKDAAEKKLPPPHVPTQEEIEAASKRSLLWFQEAWRESKFYFWCPDPDDAYNFAVKTGLIQPTAEDKKKAIRKAVDRRISELKRIVQDKRSWDYNTNLDILYKYKEGKVSPLSDKHVVNYGKLFLLIDLFEQLSREEKDLEEIIKPLSTIS